MCPFWDVNWWINQQQKNWSTCSLYIIIGSCPRLASTDCDKCPVLPQCAVAVSQLSSLAHTPLCSNFLILLSKSQFRNKRSRADIKISLHNHHNQLLKASEMIVFTLIQLKKPNERYFYDILNDFQMTLQITF